MNGLTSAVVQSDGLRDGGRNMKQEYEQAVRVLRRCCSDLGLEFIVQSPKALIGALKDEQVDPAVVARFSNVLSSSYYDRMLALFVNGTAPDVVRARQLDMLTQEGMVAPEKAVEIQEALWAMAGWTYTAQAERQEKPAQSAARSDERPAAQTQTAIADGPLFRNLDALEEMYGKPVRVKQEKHWGKKWAKALAGMAVFAGICMCVGWSGEYLLFLGVHIAPRLKWPCILALAFLLMVAYVAYESLAFRLLRAGQVKKTVHGGVGFILCGACLYAGIRVWGVGRTYGGGWEGIPWPLLMSAAAMAYPLIRFLMPSRQT